ncbi:hypothetical protein CP999_23145, partial [Klebsiella pneumoniae]
VSIILVSPIAIIIVWSLLFFKLKLGRFLFLINQSLAFTLYLWKFRVAYILYPISYMVHLY